MLSCIASWASYTDSSWSIFRWIQSVSSTKRMPTKCILRREIGQVKCSVAFLLLCPQDCYTDDHTTSWCYSIASAYTRNPLMPLKSTILDRPLCPTTKTLFSYIYVRLMGHYCFRSLDIISTYSRIYLLLHTIGPPMPHRPHI